MNQNEKGPSNIQESGRSRGSDNAAGTPKGGKPDLPPYVRQFTNIFVTSQPNGQEIAGSRRIASPTSISTRESRAYPSPHAYLFTYPFVADQLRLRETTESHGNDHAASAPMRRSRPQPYRRTSIPQDRPGLFEYADRFTYPFVQSLGNLGGMAFMGYPDDPTSHNIERDGEFDEFRKISKCMKARVEALRPTEKVWIATICRW
ncbi:hypothetical protein F5X98DRAFT_369914 [Xylaria grammica]|nr:hypothetical protein F5X98DRAFT_369914 [Xylaria grammica]